MLETENPGAGGTGGEKYSRSNNGASRQSLQDFIDQIQDGARQRLIPLSQVILDMVC